MSPNILVFCPLFVKAVQSPKAPYSRQTFPISVSTSCPIVIRLGKACGLTIISGFIPLSVKGISASGITSPIVPFCPHRLQNLSPMLGILSLRTLTFASLNPSSPSVIKVLSTYPNCPFFGKTDESTDVSGSARFVVTFPIRTFLSSRKVFSLISPYSSRSE